MMNGDLDRAVARSREIQKDDPESPLGFLLEADATWWRIYLTTGNLIDPDVFDVAQVETSSYDALFQNRVDQAIHKAAKRIREQQDTARNYLYLGLAYALRARFEGLRDHDLATARAAKKMRGFLQTALKLDPTLTDAYAGVGLYNYFVDTLPAIVKVLKIFIGLPGGNRELGLDQLRRAAEKGDLSRTEAKFYLAKDFSRESEGQYEDSLKLFQELAQEYPENFLWKLLVGSLEVRLGNADQGEAQYQEVLAKTARKDSEIDHALRGAAQKALARLHSHHEND